MSRFAKPPFTIRKIPTPPKLLVLPRLTLAIPPALKNAVLRIRGFSLGSFLTVNPLLAQVKAQEAIVKENLLKAKMQVKSALPVLPIPPSLQFDLTALQEYREQSMALLNDVQAGASQAASQAQSAAGQLNS